VELDDHFSPIQNEPYNPVTFDPPLSPLIRYHVQLFPTFPGKHTIALKDHSHQRPQGYSRQFIPASVYFFLSHAMLGGRYRISSEIGRGSFSTIHAGEHFQTHRKVAIKLERSNATPALLLHECRIYRFLSGALGFASLHWFGSYDDYTALVTDLLGPSLGALQARNCGPFPLSTVLILADQMLARIEFLHRKGYVHRDLKPENFLIGRGRMHCVVYLIDFGLSTRFCDPRTLAHIPYSESREVIGTARYISVNTHIGIAASRRDDMESLAYVLIWLVKGSLPWQGVAANTREDKYKTIGRMKMQTPVTEICAGIPHEFAVFLEQVRALRFTDEPEYLFYRRLFRRLFIESGFVMPDFSMGLF
jgi:serine/threonine protein kinase